MVTPVTKEIYVNNLLNREEFRQFCDEIKTIPETIKVLNGELTIQEIKEEDALEVIYPYFIYCFEPSGDDHCLVEIKLADFLAALHLPGLTIGEATGLRNRAKDEEIKGDKELFITNSYPREALSKRELNQDNIWRRGQYIFVSASLKEKITDAGFPYLSFKEDDWG